MKKKRHWIWNLLLVLTLIICFLAFVAHSKNWMKINNDSMRVFSGFYYKNLKFAELDSIQLVDKVPPMVRLNGFSAMDKGKGIYQEFKDTLTDRKVYIFIDNFSGQKIRLVKKDSNQVFLNLKDSLETLRLFELLDRKIGPSPE